MSIPPTPREPGNCAGPSNWASRVVVWRFPERRRQALPRFLLRYDDWIVIDGDEDAFKREILAWMDRRGFKPANLAPLEYWSGERGRDG